MATKQIKGDTFKAAQVEIAKKILNSRLATAMRDRTRDDLAAFVDGQTDRIYGIEFERAGTNITLYVDGDDWGCDRNDTAVDADGNDYFAKAFKSFTVNYPCHGSTPAGIALARFAFYGEVAMLAAELEAEFGGKQFWFMWRTKAQREESEAKREANRVAELVKKAVASVSTGMRAGATPRSVAVEMLEGLANGEYEHQDGAKHFKLVVGPGAGLVGRVS